MSDMELVRREFDSLPGRSVFVEWMAEDMHTAKEVYDKYEKARLENRWQSVQDDAYGKILTEVNARYKRQSTRNKYYTIRCAEWRERNRWGYHMIPMSSVAWSMKPWENGGCYHISFAYDMEDAISSLYDSHSDNKYLKGCKGWYIGYDQYIHLILPEELQTEWEADEKKLSDEICRFYRGTTYWGD
jgi:hypothetical protein